MGVRASDKGDMHHVRKCDIVHEPRLTEQKWLVLEPRHAPPENLARRRLQAEASVIVGERSQYSGAGPMVLQHRP